MGRIGSDSKTEGKGNEEAYGLEGEQSSFSYVKEESGAAGAVGSGCNGRMDSWRLTETPYN